MPIGNWFFRHLQAFSLPYYDYDAHNCNAKYREFLFHNWLIRDEPHVPNCSGNNWNYVISDQRIKKTHIYTQWLRLFYSTLMKNKNKLGEYNVTHMLPVSLWVAQSARCKQPDCLRLFGRHSEWVFFASFQLYSPSRFNWMLVSSKLCKDSSVQKPHHISAFWSAM